jgi:arsenate reductase
MAEGLTHHVHGDRIDARSAGMKAHGLDPRAVAAMAEIDIDITNQVSTEFDRGALQESDLLITVCGHAHETCPLVPDASRIVHRPFDDPPSLVQEAVEAGHAGDPMDPYRRVRDEIRTFVQRELPAMLE